MNGRALKTKGNTCSLKGMCKVQKVWKKNMKTESDYLGWNPSSNLISSIALSKLCNLLKPHFLKPLNVDDNIITSLPQRVNRLAVEYSRSE